MNQPLQTLTTLARKLHARLPLPAILQAVTDDAADLIDTQRTSLRLLDPSGTRLIAVARARSPLRLGPRTSGFYFGEGLVGWIVAHGQPLRTGQAQRDPRFVDRADVSEPVGSFLGVPLLAGASCMGVLSAAHPEPDFFEQEHEDLLLLLAAIAAPHVELARLSRLLPVDALTGALGPVALEQELSEQHAAPEDEALSIALADIDQLARVNELYGPAIGDEVLRTVAERLQGVLRKGDAVVRRGGEEFLLIMREAQLDEGACVAERARAAVEEQAVVADDLRIGVTVSVGVTECHADESREQALERVEQALRTAKQDGRNRVIRR